MPSRKTSNGNKNTSGDGVSVHTPEYMKRVGMEFVHRLSHTMLNYTKIILVRNPLDRMISAYEDKFMPKVSFRLRALEQYITAQRRNTEMKYERRPTGITFNEFVLGMGEVGFPPNQMQVHFNTYYSICRICQITYDYIVFQETLMDDASYIFKHILKSDMDPHQLLNPRKGPTSDENHSNLTKHQRYATLTPRAKSIIRSYLLPDSVLFGYDIDKWLSWIIW